MLCQLRTRSSKNSSSISQKPKCVYLEEYRGGRQPLNMKCWDLRDLRVGSGSRYLNVLRPRNRRLEPRGAPPLPMLKMYQGEYFVQSGIAPLLCTISFCQISTPLYLSPAVSGAAVPFHGNLPVDVIDPLQG